MIPMEMSNVRRVGLWQNLAGRCIRVVMQTSLGVMLSISVILAQQTAPEQKPPNPGKTAPAVKKPPPKKTAAKKTAQPPLKGTSAQSKPKTAPGATKNKAIAKKGAKPVPKKPTEPPTLLLSPPGFDPKRKYPVLVAMPYTGGTGTNFVEYYLFTEYNPKKSLQKKWESTLKEIYPDSKLRSERAYFILIPGGKGSTADHSWRGFASAMARYEARIIAGLNTYAKKYPLNLNRVALAGHSLGGDLSWALSLRKPSRYIGAVISGSRTSYWEDDKLELLAKKHFRYFFSMGELETRVRLMGLSGTLERLFDTGMDYRIHKALGVGHKPPDKENLVKAVEYVLLGINPEPEPETRLAKHKPANPPLPSVTPEDAAENSAGGEGEDASGTPSAEEANSAETEEATAACAPATEDAPGGSADSGTGAGGTAETPVANAAPEEAPSLPAECAKAEG
ncbi:MAG: hypothetical protein OEW39_15035 [Deltaproteobacteria bacterium]|nr:hypothetical protein [Deltaproteobacteria bacterium]